MRLVPALAGSTCLVGAFAMANAVDSGVTRGWSSTARYAWVAVMLVLVLVGVGMMLNAFGQLTNERLASSVSGPSRAPTVSQFIAVYVGVLLVAVANALWFARAHGVRGERILVGIFGALFMIASLGRPWWFFGTIRRLGWFALIESDVTMRRVLAALGAILIAVGWFDVR